MECQNEGLTPDINKEEVEMALIGIQQWKCYGTRRNSGGGLEELGIRRGRYVVGSITEDVRAEQNARGM